MEQKIFEAGVKAVGGKIGFLNKRAYSMICDMTEAADRIIAAGECIDTDGSGAIVVTERMFYGAKATGLFSSAKTVLPLTGIGSAMLSGGIFSRALTITDGTRSYVFPQVSNADAILAAIKAGKSVTASSPDAAQDTTSIDIAAELRKFKGLLNEGLITQEDFDKKKTALLGL
jgi:hypothetical protein